MRPMPFEIRYSTVAVKQLKGCRAFDRATILDEIEQHLTINPAVQSKAKIKKLRQPAATQFRLRVGSFRIFYDVDDDANRVNIVQILSKADSFRYLEG